MGTSLSLVGETPWPDQLELESSGTSVVPADETSPSSPEEDAPASLADSDFDEEAEPAGESEALDDESAEEAPQAPAAESKQIILRPAKGGTPFAFKADGAVVEVPGALRYDNGVFIPKASWPVMQQHLANRRQWQQNVVGFQQAYAQLQAHAQMLEATFAERLATHPEVLNSRALLDQWAKLMETGPDGVQDWLLDFERNRPLLEARAEAQAATMRANIVEQGNQRRAAAEQQARADAELQPKLAKLLIDNLVWYAGQPQFAALNDQTVLTEVHAALQDPSVYGLLFVKAERDIPEEDLRAGDVDVNRRLLENLLMQQVKLRGRVKQVAGAAAFNRRVLSDSRQAPPAPRRAGVESRDEAAVGGAIPTFKTQADYDLWVRTGRLPAGAAE